MTILCAGLVVSLVGPLLLVLATKRFSLDSFSFPSRLSLWLLAFISLAIAACGDDSWPQRMGLVAFGPFDLLDAAAAIVAMLVGAVLLQLLLTKLGLKNPKGVELQRKIHALPARYRLFVVVTAAVTEEILYRGYAIGIGQEVWGNLAIAFVVSLSVFVAAHFAHGLKALAAVFWISLVMSFLFVLTNNLFICIFVHFVVDATGVLFAPWLAARQRARRALSANEG